MRKINLCRVSRLTFFRNCVEQVEPSMLPLREGQTVEQLVEELTPVMFDPSVLAKRTVQSGDADLIEASANHYYGEGVTQKEVEDFYAAMKAGKDTITPNFIRFEQPARERKRSFGRKRSGA